MPAVATLLDAAMGGDHRAVRHQCSRALAGGLDIADLVVDVLAPLQREVGERWLTARASVADEHRATAALDSVLAAMELELAPSTRSAPVICVCAEGEWHAVAARMMALVVASRGWPVVFLGPSLPAADLGAAARDLGAAAVAISTSTVAALPGTARCVRAVVDAGRPVLVGGQAFAAVPGAAEALGVPLFGDPRDAIQAIEDPPPTPGPVGLDDQEVLALDVAESSLVDLVAEGLRTRSPFPPPLRSTVGETARYVVGFARAAILLQDGSVVSSHLQWIETFARSRGLELTGAHILDAVGEAGDRLLEDPRPLRSVLVG